MPDSDPAAASLARRLLDAQVAFHLDRLDDDRLATTVSDLAAGLFEAAGRHQLEDLVDREAVKAIVSRSLVEVPRSAAVSGIVELATEVVHAGPAEPYAFGDLVARERVEALLDALLALTPALDRGLERLTDSPLVVTVASRFMARIVAEVLQANQAVADKVPGLGSLMSFGTSAASRMMGAADKQFEGLLGAGVGSRGGAFAVRRLNRIVVETLQDPTTRAAVLEVWDRLAREQVAGLGDHASRAEVAGVVDAVHDLVVDTLAGGPVADLGDVVVDAFFDRFGGFTPTELLDELAISRGELTSDAVRMAPRILEALRESGDLERIVRGQLEPFYASIEVAALLDGPR